MLVVKRPTAIVFGWEKSVGKYEFITDLFSSKENLMGWVDLHSLPESDFPFNMDFLMKRYVADCLVIIGESFKPDFSKNILHKIVFFNDQPSDIEIANSVLSKVVSNYCSPYTPEFSIFTPAYKTGKRIFRTYESVANQTFTDWEWVVVDDSPEGDDEVWEYLIAIADKDNRVKPHRIKPNSGGIVGNVKKRACLLSHGKWLVELDHDDALTNECLDTILKASQKFPDAGFVYSDCCEFHSDGSFRRYDDRTDWDFYGDVTNFYNFGYSGHSWVEADGKKVLRHHSPSINPVSIRFNVSMPNHVRAWKRDIYTKIGGHSTFLPIADDFELIIRTFLETRMIHIKKVLYFQYNNGKSTVDMNSFEINRISRIIKDIYNEKINQRISDLGFFDWDWNDELKTSHHQEAWVLYDHSDVKFGEEEQVLNYIFE